MFKGLGCTEPKIGEMLPKVRLTTPQGLGRGLGPGDWFCYQLRLVGDNCVQDLGTVIYWILTLS